MIKNTTLPYLSLKITDVVEALQYSGLQILKEEHVTLEPSKSHNVDNMTLFITRKK